MYCTSSKCRFHEECSEYRKHIDMMTCSAFSAISQCWSVLKLQKIAILFFWLGAQHKKHLKGQLSGSRWQVFTPSDRTSDIIRLKELLTTYSHVEKGMLFYLCKTGCLDLFLHFWSATSLFLKWILTCHAGMAWESNTQQTARSMSQMYLQVSKPPFW